jgi:hypothetical protein
VVFFTCTWRLNPSDAEPVDLLKKLRALPGVVKVTDSVDPAEALEYHVIEHYFHYFQYYNRNQKPIPGPGASADEIFEHLFTAILIPGRLQPWN